MITRKDVLALVGQQHEVAVSIYIPTHRAGKEVMNEKDRIHLKNQVKAIRQELEAANWKPNDLQNFLKPVDELVQNDEFWRYQSDGLAIFLADGVFEKFTIPMHFEAFHYINRQFYLKPLLPLFNGDCLFYILSLQKDEVKMFEGTAHSITEIKIDDLTPDRLEDRVGQDYKEKHLGVRTQQGNGGGGIYHGYGDGKDDKKEELHKYFRAVDEGVMKLLHDVQKAPLVLACVDYYFPIYQEVCTHHNLYPEHIAAVTADDDIPLLHEHAINVLKPHFEQDKKQKMEQFRALHGTGKASSDISKILPQALAGRVEAVFFENLADIFGSYNPEKQLVEVKESNGEQTNSLVNQLACLVFEKGGSVFILDKEDMPDNQSVVNAVYRY